MRELNPYLFEIILRTTGDDPKLDRNVPLPAHHDPSRVRGVNFCTTHNWIKNRENFYQNIPQKRCILTPKINKKKVTFRRPGDER